MTMFVITTVSTIYTQCKSKNLADVSVFSVLSLIGNLGPLFMLFIVEVYIFTLSLLLFLSLSCKGLICHFKVRKVERLIGNYCKLKCIKRHVKLS